MGPTYDSVTESVLSDCIEGNLRISFVPTGVREEILVKSRKITTLEQPFLFFFLLLIMLLLSESAKSRL